MESPVINYIYDKSVDILFSLAHLTGLSYRQVNVIVFTVIEPIVYIILVIWIIRLYQIIYNLKSSNT
jgi:hypothetical protein